MSEHDITVASFIVAAGAALLNIILIPLAKSAARGEVTLMVDEHNANANAHPNLHHATKIEDALRDLAKDTNEQFNGLRKEVADLRVALAPLIRRNE